MLIDMFPQRGDNTANAVIISVFIREICMEEAKTMRNVKLKSEFIRYTASDGAFFRKTTGTPPPPLANTGVEAVGLLKAGLLFITCL
jgi:hypothetical protein